MILGVATYGDNSNLEVIAVGIRSRLVNEHNRDFTSTTFLRVSQKPISAKRRMGDCVLPTTCGSNFLS